MAIEKKQLRAALQDGLLSFPVTDMDREGKFNPSGYEKRLKWLISNGASSVFVAGGTGEFFSLSQEEYRQIVELAARTVEERVPVIASVGRSIPEALAFSTIAERAGIHALLLMPPYLANAPEEGILEYAKTIMDHTSLPVIYYNRANGVLSSSFLSRLADSCPNLIGLKDGTGNLAELNDTIKSLGDRLSYIGGVPTAEIIAEAYLSIGVNTYSSAVFNFVPRLAMHFYQALRAGDKETVKLLLNSFYIPFVRLRSRQNGYAVSLIKAGANIIGRQAGDVRAPLLMPSAAEVNELKTIIERGNQLLD